MSCFGHWTTRGCWNRNSRFQLLSIKDPIPLAAATLIEALIVKPLN